MADKPINTAVAGTRELDQVLVERAQQGDKKAFGMLVEKYHRKLGRLLSRMIRDQVEVEDVVQESFIKTYEKLNSFEGRSSFKSWLYFSSERTVPASTSELPGSTMMYDSQ